MKSGVRVALDMVCASRADAVRAVTELLRGDPRVGSWETFAASIGPRQVVDLKGCSCGVCLAHGRDASVHDLALAAGRLARPLGPEGLRCIFVFAIPSAMAEDYLRAVGALARACSQEGKMASLLAAATGEEFAAALDAIIS